MSICGTALQGFRSSVRGITVAAHNLPNVNTQGFRAQRSEAPSNGDAISKTGAPSDVDIATEAVRMKQYTTAFRANAMVVSVADRMQAESLDVLA